MAAPEGAPALVLAVPGTPSNASRSLAEEVVSIARSELPGLDARIGYLDGDDSEAAEASAFAEFPSLRAVLSRAAKERTARFEQARAAAPASRSPTDRSPWSCPCSRARTARSRAASGRP